MNDHEHDTPPDTPDAPEPEQSRREPLAVRIKSRVTLRKFDGDDTSGDPVESLEFKDEGFDEFVAELEKERSNATD